MKKMVVIIFAMAAATVSQAYVIPWVSYDNFSSQSHIDPSRWFVHKNPSTSIYVDPLSETARLISVHTGGLPAAGELVAANHDIFGIRADMCIEPIYNQAAQSELLLEVSLSQDLKASIGLYGSGANVKGRALIRSEIYGDIIPPIFFDAHIGQSCNLGITVLEHTSQVGFYKDNQLLASIPFPAIAFNDAAFEVKAIGGWNFASIDNVQVIPEPVTAAVLGLGGLLLRRYQLSQSAKHE